MPFVGYVPTSPQAQELAQRLAQTVEQFRQQHPELKSYDVARAFMIAGAGRDSTARRRRAGVVAALAGVMAAMAGGLTSHVARTGWPAMHGSVTWIYVIAAVVVLVFVIVALVLSRANSSSS